MNTFWEYFWPLVSIGFACGAIGGIIAWRRKRPYLLGTIALLVAMAGGGLWHGPLGGAERLAGAVENMSRAVLVNWEMPQVQARLQREPLSRQLLLSGAADDFQRTELVRMMSNVDGVSDATWSAGNGVPLIVEAAGATLLGFLVGLLLAYVVELRRRHNAQWKW